MPTELSVILCTHNPRADILARTLDSLRTQTLDRARWELVIVDNASPEPLTGRVDLAWHPHGRIVSEPTLGHTSARVAGIHATTGPLIVFIDDDNIFAPDYLATALELDRAYPFLGAWGGAVTGEFEVAPPPWAKPYLGWLALRDPDRAHWSNSTLITESVPCGAGMCVRRPVAATWAGRVRTDPARLSLGRIGQGLGAGDDADLAFVACDLGLGNGVFPQLRVLHLIPARRVTLEYLERLVEDMSRTEVILRSLRHPVAPYREPTLSARLFNAYSDWRMPDPIRRLLRASKRGYRAGVEAAQALRPPAV